MIWIRKYISDIAWKSYWISLKTQKYIKQSGLKVRACINDVQSHFVVLGRTFENNSHIGCCLVQFYFGKCGKYHHDDNAFFSYGTFVKLLLVPFCGYLEASDSPHSIGQQMSDSDFPCVLMITPLSVGQFSLWLLLQSLCFCSIGFHIPKLSQDGIHITATAVYVLNAASIVRKKCIIRSDFFPSCLLVGPMQVHPRP